MNEFERDSRSSRVDASARTIAGPNVTAVLVDAYLGRHGMKQVTQV